MEAITDDDLGDALRDASQGAGRPENGRGRPSIVSVAAALRCRAADPHDPLGEIAAALEYYPVDGCEHVVLEPAARPSGCACATSLAPSDPDVLPLWARALAFSPRPLVAARFADLLWCARYGDTPHEWAQRSIDASLASAYDEFGHVLEISEALQRALDLTTEIDDQPRRAAVLAAMVGLADRSIASDEGSSGIALSIIEFLASLAPDSRPPELTTLLERAIDRYHDDPWLLEPALDIKARLSDPGVRPELHDAQVEAFARLARTSSGLLRHLHYEHAISLAKRNGLSERALQLRAEVDGKADEQIDRVDGAPQEDSPERSDPVDEFVDRIVGDDTLGEALARFGASLPTEGYPDAFDEAEQQRLAFFGSLAVDLLARIGERYGLVSAAGSWFQCALVDTSVASGIAHGVELSEAGDFDGSVAVMALQLDRIVRSIACAAGLGEPAAKLGITDVLEALEGALYEPTRRYLNVLLPATSSNATAVDAALLSHAACHLRLLQPVELIRPDTPQG